MSSSKIVLNEQIVRGIIQDLIDLLRSIHDVGGHECSEMINGLQGLLSHCKSLANRKVSKEQLGVLVTVMQYQGQTSRYLRESQAPIEDLNEWFFYYIESCILLNWIGVHFDSELISTLEAYFSQVEHRHCQSKEEPTSSAGQGKTSTKTNVQIPDSAIEKEIKGLEKELGEHLPHISVTPFSSNKDYESELEELTGLNNVKRSLIEHIINHLMLKERQELHPDINQQSSFNIIFKGRPGTGKTTVARLFAGILKKRGILTNGHLIEVDATTLINPFIGVSAKIAKYVAMKAIDGVLFIDEAYALRGGKGNHCDVGAEVIDALTPILENYRDRLVVVLAGYNKEMDEMLAQVNTGFASRFTQSITFEDYNAEEMLSIFMGMATRDFYQLDDKCVATLLGVFDLLYRKRNKAHGFANARTVRTIYETVCSRASNRMAQNKLSGADLDCITIEDIRLTPQELRAAMGIL